jgi:hypothetical protein
MNKYLEKVAVVNRLIKATRRATQLIHTGSHDFHSTNFPAFRKAISEGKLGLEHGHAASNEGQAVYFGKGGPAHGYHPTDQTRPYIAVPHEHSHSVEIPSSKNPRMGYAKKTDHLFMDSISRHDVPIRKGSYVVLPDDFKGRKLPKTNHPQWDHYEAASISEEKNKILSHIKNTHSRVVYHGDIANAMKRRGSQLDVPYDHSSGGNHLFKERLGHASEKVRTQVYGPDMSGKLRRRYEGDVPVRTKANEDWDTDAALHSVHDDLKHHLDKYKIGRK